MTDYPPPDAVTESIGGVKLFFWIGSLARAGDSAIVCYRAESDLPGQALRTAPAHYLRGCISAFGFKLLNEVMQ